jgi:hypothetical protein
LFWYNAISINVYTKKIDVNGYSAIVTQLLAIELRELIGKHTIGHIHRISIRYAFQFGLIVIV